MAGNLLARLTIFFDFQAKIFDEWGSDNVQSFEYICFISLTHGNLIAFNK
jgi:hypothetical protein